MHPEVEEIVHHIRQRGILAVMITNGYLLTPQRIEHLNRARHSTTYKSALTT